MGDLLLALEVKHQNAEELEVLRSNARILQLLGSFAQSSVLTREQSESIFGSKRFPPDPPLAAANFVDDDPGHGTRVFAFDAYHRIRKLRDDLFLL
jgi:hypothetical protein